MERWSYWRINVVAGLIGGFVYIFFASFAGGTLNPSKDLLTFASLEGIALLLANGLALWRNLSIRRAEQRFRQQWAARAAQHES